MSSDELPHIFLPGGRKVACINADEARSLYDELWREGTYLRGGITLERGATIVDAGANIGMFALWAIEQCDGLATIHSFEPIPAVYQVLQRNAYACGARITAHAVGLSDCEEEDNVRFHPKISLWSTRHQAMDENRLREMRRVLPSMVSAATQQYKEEQNVSYPAVAQRVSDAMSPVFQRRLEQRFDSYEEVVRIRCRFIRLGDYLRERRIDEVDLLKIDTEGDELRILRGVNDEQWPAIRQVAMEVDGIGSGCADEVAAFLRERGYSVQRKEQQLFGASFAACGFENHRPVMIFAHRHGARSETISP